MQRVEAYRVEIPIVATDQYSSELSRANRAVEATNRTASSAARSQDGLSRSSQGVARAQDGVSRSTRNASRGVDDVGRSAEQTERRVSRTTRTIESFGNRIKALQRAKATVEIAVRDNASRVLDRVRGSWDGFRHNPITRLTVSAVDRANSILRGIKNTVLSIPTMITIGLSYVGVKSLSGATVGAAMNWEKYEVSMEHWLDGNTKKAKELTKWMGEFADITPFSSPELFPALTTAVSMADKDLNKAKRLTQIAANMAALTPGQTPEDAMQALFNASMGNTTRMKMYGIADGVDDIKKMGGFDKWINKVETTFAGGAEKLSKTASGIIATLKGYRGSFMRSIGTGFLEPMKPRLDSINQWLAENQDKWGRWKSVAMGHGKDLSEFIFSSLEKSFGFIQGRYLENPDFMNLDLKGKFNFVGADIKGYMNGTLKPQLMEWWEETGSGVAVEIGKNIGSGIVEGIKIGFKAGGELLATSYSDLLTNFKETGFSEETGKSALGATAATAGAAFLGKKFLYNPAKSVFGAGKKAGNWLFGGSVAGASAGALLNRGGDREQTGTRSRSALRSRNRVSPFSKILKKVPLIGAAVTALSLIDSGKENIGGGIGAIGGGLAGAKGGAMAGAAIGSIVPGVGTAIGAGVGGLVGGIGGSFGGEWIGELVGEHWDTIKGKAADTASWIETKFMEATDIASATILSGDWWGGKWDSVKDGASNSVKWVEDKWDKTATWFDKTIWTPISDTAINATNLVVGAWSYSKDGITRLWKPFSDSFQTIVWDPIVTGVETVGRLIGEKFETAKKVAYTSWDVASGWFQDTVWTPLSVGAEAVKNVIGREFDRAKGIVSAAWGPVESWFQETVWTPVSIAAEVAGNRIGEEFQKGYTVMTSAWGAAESWFETNVWSPLKVGASAVASVFADKLAVIKAGAASFGDVASDRVHTLKTGLSIGYEILTKRGSEKTGLEPSKEYARGGIARSPHIGLVAEAGVPEAMIPWDGSSRSKALWQQTGEALGMFDGGSSAGGNSDSGSSGGGVASIGGVLAVNIGDINVDGGMNMSAEEIMNMIMPALYEKIVASLAKR